MDENLRDRDILLVKEDGNDELKAVAGINADNGKLQTISPKQENQSDFLKFDRHGNALDNFLTNFSRQLKNPTHFQFFKAPADSVEKAAENLQFALSNPKQTENQEVLDMHRVELPQSKKEFAINSELVDWQKFERYGITRDTLEKSGRYC